MSDPRRVLLIGDSLTSSGEAELFDAASARGWDLRVRAEIGRSMASVVPILGSVSGYTDLIVALGTNDIAAAGRTLDGWIDDAMSATGCDRVWWVDVGIGDRGAPVNGALERALDRYPSLRLIRWSQAVEGDPGLLASDGVHLSERGRHHRAAVVLDALSRAYPPPVGGIPSLAVHPEGSTPWWREAVVYQIYPRSFADSNGDGVGDLRGIIDRVDHIASLGVDAVWLSPIFRSPMADFGYDVADYCAVDPIFGSDADLDDLIAALRDRGIRLLLDWVPNHTSDQHPWFVAARSSRDDPHRDWYVWRDRGPDGSPPTNWMATFKGVPAWTHDDATDQSYLHLFLAEQPDLNWANPEVEAAMHDVLRYWLDRGIDGFRADVVHLIGKGTDVDDLPEHQASLPILAVDRPLGHRLLARIRRLLDGYEHQPMMVGEVYLLGEGETASYLGDPDHGDGELHLSFDFRPIYTGWDAPALHAAIAAVQADFAEPHWPTWVLSNHDQPRHATRFDDGDPRRRDARTRAAAVLSLTMRGTTFLYAGEELGLTDATVPDERVVDPAGRDGCRAPIPWTADGDETNGHGWPARPWLPFPTNAATNSVEALEADPASLLHLYRDLLRLRREHPALRRGTMELAPLAGGLVRYRRAADGDAVTVLANLGAAPVPWPDDVDGLVLARTGDDEGRIVHPDEAVIVGC